MSGKYIDRHELVETFDVVAKHLGAAPMESITSAALRVFRQNCAPQVTLDVARIVIEMGGKTADVQWEHLQRCARMIRGSAPSLN